MVRIPLRNLFHPVLIGAVALAWAGVKVASPSRAEKVTARWWKGNLHTHSLWSDGDNYPDMIADWYRQRDYQFLACSRWPSTGSGSAPPGWRRRKRTAPRRCG